MRILVLSLALATVLIPSCAPRPAGAEPAERAVVLILVDGLSWSAVERGPNLSRIFDGAAVANLSTAQGETPEDTRMGYVFLGAAARVDTAVLPERLPDTAAEIPRAFSGPASTVRPGTFGEALKKGGVEAAAVGEDARLVVMDRDGRVPAFRDAAKPFAGLEEALEGGAGLVAVEASSTAEAGRLAGAALQENATVAVASPNAAPGGADLTPFALWGEQGLLYSPTTRTEGLISNADLAPTLLTALGMEPPPEMQGRAATVRPGTSGRAERLGGRLTFVERERFVAWAVVGVAAIASSLLAGLLSGRRVLRPAALALAALPAGALFAAVLPLTNAMLVAAATTLFAAALALVSWRFSLTASGALAAVCLTTAALVAADAAAGGTLMRFSTLGYNPAQGTRFYGAGNEYAAVLAGSLTMGLGALYHRWKVSIAPVAMAGVAVVLVLGLPTMGADVGGSLALGFGLGATLGLVRGAGMRAVALWAVGGLFLAAMLFVASGLFFPEVSHGSRAASGGGGLPEILVRKLLLSLGLLLNPLLILLLVAAAAVVYAGWRRARGTALAAGMLGAAVTAAVSGALNDSGIVSSLFVLAYPVIAAFLVLVDNGRTKTC